MLIGPKDGSGVPGVGRNVVEGHLGQRGLETAAGSPKEDHSLHTRAGPLRREGTGGGAGGDLPLPGAADRLAIIGVEYDGKPAEIDLVIVNRYGVFIFEVKNYNGVLIGGEDDYEWQKPCKT